MEKTYRTDVDYDLIKDLSFEDLIKHIKENFYDPQYPTARGLDNIAQIMHIISKYLGLSLSNEQYIFMLSNVRRLLCEATAGAGKTTISQLVLFSEKIANGADGKQILALAYNRSARKIMETKHAAFALKINSLKISNLHVSPNLCAKTIHSFCMDWINEYCSRFGVERDAFNLTDENYARIMRLAINTAVNQYNKANADNRSVKAIVVHDADTSNFIRMFDYLNETLEISTPGVWSTLNVYKDIDRYPVALVEKIYRFFTTAAHAQGKYPFSEWMELVYQLMCDPTILARFRRNYSVILVDEYQDITPAMLRIITMLTEGDPTLGISDYPECRLICIGDNDQSIYRFRGTDPFNCMRFVDTYGHGKSTRVVSMSVNRRCKQVVLDKAKQIIAANQERISKPIVAYKDGGSVAVSEYGSLQQEMQFILSELKFIPVKDYSDTCICYRNNSSAMFITTHLLDAGIPFRIISGDPPFSDKLSQTIQMVLGMLTHPTDKYHMKQCLYRVLPRSPTFTRKILDKMIDDVPEDTKFWELKYFELNKIEGFNEALIVLVYGYRALRLKTVKRPKAGYTSFKEDDADTYEVVRISDLMSTYMLPIISLIEKYYFNFQNWDREEENTLLSDEYISYVKKYFSRPMTYEDFLKEWSHMLKQTSGDQGGVYLSTFHTLKGLEFKNVIVADLDDGIFPGTDFKGSSKLNAEQKTIIEDETRRLLYVVCTRAIDRVHLMFSAERPSRFIRFFKETPDMMRTFNSSAEDKDGFIAPDDILVEFSQVNATPADNFKRNSEDDYASNNLATGARASQDMLADIFGGLGEFGASSGFVTEDLSSKLGKSAGLESKPSIKLPSGIKELMLDYTPPYNSGDPAVDTANAEDTQETTSAEVPDVFLNLGLWELSIAEESVEVSPKPETDSKMLVGTMLTREIPVEEIPVEEVLSKIESPECVTTVQESLEGDPLAQDLLGGNLFGGDLFGGLEIPTTDVNIAQLEMPDDSEFQHKVVAEETEQILTGAVGLDNLERLADKPQVRNLLGRIAWGALNKPKSGEEG